MTFLPFVFCVVFGASSAISPDAVLSEIHALGAHAVVIKVFDDQEFGESVLKGVSSGSIKWVRVAAKLLPEADASVSLGLASSLAMALAQVPENVLPLVNSSPEFEARRICLPFMSGEVADEIHLANLQKLELALAGVSTLSLQKAKNACIRELETMRSILRH